uniref:Thiamin biosynthesis protein S n=1 Tax=Lophocladia kuetzingii TaxID=675577 RepID=A0A1Z1MNT4_9FLOR|nr:thiamin biosynthesis protein S [Lophocladia kuetzingii]ARW67750.1 thiamin biosynthesis protein S [Lophocladia kuetzingii]
MENYLTIFVNGEPFNCECSMSLLHILLYLNFNISSVIVEYNDCILDKTELDSIYLKNYDHIEVITVVGGG